MPGDTSFRATLQVRGVSKRFIAGAGSCTIGVTALSAASIDIRGGEVLIVAGPRGSGKTTLLLCAAGLLRCDCGEIAGSARTVVYRDLLQPARSIEPMRPGAVLMLDSCDELGELPRLRAARVIGDAVSVGAAVVLAAREAESCVALTPPSTTISVVHLRLGESSAQRTEIGLVHRVAEAAGGGY
jgi:energy-coupling factor transporter ATP-binding protein EcfA2